MNIGIDIKALYAGQGGIAAYISRVLNALQEIDRDNNYFLFEKNPSSYNIVNPRWKKVVVGSKLPGTVWLLLKLPFYFSKYSLDVFWGPEQICACVFNPAKVKMISTIHDVAVKVCPETMQTSNYWINRLFLKASIRKSNKVLTVSQCIKKEICSYYPKEISPADVVVTYLGKPDWVISDKDIIVRKDHLLFVGSFEPRKNLMALLCALLVCRKEMGKTIALRVIGPSGWKNNLTHKFIVDNDLSTQVTFSGFLDETGLLNEYRTCKAFIYPSIYEGFGLPILEAMAAGAPVLTSRGTSMEEFAAEAVVLFDPLAPRDIAEKIALVYSADGGHRGKMEKYGALLQRFAWKKTASEILRILTSE